MFNFLKKNKSQPAQAAEDVRFDAFKEHWKQVKAVLEATGPWSTGTRNIGKHINILCDCKMACTYLNVTIISRSLSDCIICSLHSVLHN